MTSHEEIRQVAMALPGVGESTDWFGFHVTIKGKPKGFIWCWAERVAPKKPRERNDEVLIVLVPNLGIKDLLIESDPGKFFTEPHYNGFPAVHVRLDEIEIEELAPMIVEAWRCKAPAKVVAEFDESAS